MPIFSQIMIASLVVSSVSLVGGILLFWRNIFNEKHTVYYVSFAAGVMLTTALIDLLPEALESGVEDHLFVALLLGVVVFFFMERSLIWFHHHDDTHQSKPSSFLILFGDGFHNAFDGIAIAAAFLTNPAVGIATTIAIAAHEIPQEIADFSVLVHGGMKKKTALLLNFLSAFTALAGALLGYFFLHALEEYLPIFLAFSAGMFIYIACSDLIPDLHQDFKKQKAWSQSIPFIVGIVIAYSFITLLEHH